MMVSPSSTSTNGIRRDRHRRQLLQKRAREEEHPSSVLQGMRHAGAPMLPAGARRRRAMVAGLVLALAAFLAWRRSVRRAPEPAPAAAVSQPGPLPAERGTPPPAPRLAAPAI